MRGNPAGAGGTFSVKRASERQSLASSRSPCKTLISTLGWLSAAVEKIWLPALDELEPQMIFVSAGFDAHVEDKMAGLRFTEADYAWVTQRIKEVADKYAGGKIVSVLEGGYALSALGRSVVTHLKVLGSL